jgi:hypothetical protein
LPSFDQEETLNVRLAMNNEEWLQDGRKIPDEVMGYIRKIAVQAVRERGQSPEVVAQIFNFNRSCIYRWLKHYDEGGYEALESQPAQGAEPVVTDARRSVLKGSRPRFSLCPPRQGIARSG